MISAAMVEAIEGTRDTSRHHWFLELIARYEPSLRRLAGAYLRRQADQEDLVQEIALAIWKAIPRFRGDSSERTWLYRIAHNVAITAATRSARRGKTEERISEGFERASGAADAERELLNEEKRRWLVDSVRDLPEIDRHIVVLHLEGLSYAEIQGVTGLSESAVATRLSRTRARLRDELRDKEAGRQ